MKYETEAHYCHILYHVKLTRLQKDLKGVAQDIKQSLKYAICLFKNHLEWRHLRKAKIPFWGVEISTFLYIFLTFKIFVDRRWRKTCLLLKRETLLSYVIRWYMIYYTTTPLLSFRNFRKLRSSGEQHPRRSQETGRRLKETPNGEDAVFAGNGNGQDILFDRKSGGTTHRVTPAYV